jgi:DNA-binding SARP family transcriptional activator
MEPFNSTGVVDGRGRIEVDFAGGVGGDPGSDVRVPRTQLMRLCRAALGAGVAIDDATRCLAVAAQGEDRGDILSPESHRVAVYTLGRFALLVQGRPLAFNGKSPHKPIELLQALVALGGRGVHAELLIGAVWPADDSVDPRNLLDNTLHRLRRLLAGDDAITLHDGKLTLDATRCWVDAWAFDHLARLAASAAASAPPWLAAQQALWLYHGAFLAREAPRPWARAYRDRLHGRFLRLVAAEGARLESAGRWHDAAACYERGLEIDPLAEVLYQALMAGHARHGAVADVVRVFARCREHLTQALGVAPSAATQAIRRAATAPSGVSPP